MSLRSFFFSTRAREKTNRQKCSHYLLNPHSPVFFLPPLSLWCAIIFSHRLHFSSPAALNHHLSLQSLPVCLTLSRCYMFLIFQQFLSLSHPLQPPTPIAITLKALLPVQSVILIPLLPAVAPLLPSLPLIHICSLIQPSTLAGINPTLLSVQRQEGNNHKRIQNEILDPQSTVLLLQSYCNIL